LGISKPLLDFVKYHNFQGIIPNTIIDDKLNMITVALLIPNPKIQYRSSTMLNPNIAYGPNNKLNISKADNSK
jgi:hypothetical protein